MCGFVACAGVVPDDVVISMRDTMHHRGPDADGLAVWHNAALAHCRLNIIDLDGGKQPMSNEDETVWVAFNGEIYNFEGLRKELEQRGHRFRTRSDTEVLVHLYEEDGYRCVERLRGDFAFAVWNRRDQEMFLARDRLGVKPLYYTIVGGTLLAASEIKALLVHPSVTRDMDVTALDEYLSYLYVPCPRTIFAQVRQLPPAHWLRFHAGRATMESYWQPPLTRNGVPTRVEDAVGVVRDALDDAVQVRLMSDVPLGAFLSGGIDSSSIVASMARTSSRPVRTFTIRFPAENDKYDEGPGAQRVARRLGTDHVELEAKADCTEYLDDMVHGFDQPFGNPTALLVYVLSQLTRQHVTVALAGDGGDELFGGYPRYRGLKWLRGYRFAPRFIRTSLGKVAGKVLRDRLDGSHTRRRLREFLEAGEKPLWEGYLGWIGYWDEFDKSALYTDEFRQRLGPIDSGDWLASKRTGMPAADLLASASALDLATFLPENLLAYSDRMSMAHALELRVPFTDHLLIEAVLPLSETLKWRQGRLKGLLRTAMVDRLPRETLDGEKIGFNPPMAAWLNGRLSPLLEDYLSEESVERRAIFSVERIENLKNELRCGGRDVSLHLWALVVLECWMRKFVD